MIIVNKMAKPFVGQIELDKEQIKIDSADRKILYLLCANARYSETAIAKALRMKRETVGYRIRKMLDTGIIDGFLTVIDSRRLGFRMHTLCIKLKQVGAQQRVIDTLIPKDNVTCIETFGGNYDLQLVVASKSLEEFDGFMEWLLSEYFDIIQKYVILEMIDDNFAGLNFLLTPAEISSLKISESKGSTFESELAKAKKKAEVVDVDEHDVKILKLLSLNARMPIAEISKKVNLAVPAVENRIRRLVSEEVIQAFVAVAPLGMLGFQWYTVFFQVKNLNKKRFLAYLKQNTNTTWYTKIVGKWNYQFSVFAKDNTEFNKILNRIRDDFTENIISYDSVIVFSQKKLVSRIQ
jgi:Lrp/AsnC family leucine-responsive transcriptional regulator